VVSFRDIKPQTFGFHDLDRLGSLDVTGRVTLRTVVGGFVYVVHCNQLAVSHGCQDNCTSLYPPQILRLQSLGSNPVSQIFTVGFHTTASV